MKHTRVTLATASSVLLLAALAACGSSDPAAPATGPTTSQEGAGPAGGQLPGAIGKVAAVSGRTAQVQSDLTGQVAVSWNGDTTFTHQVDASLSDVAVGSCVMVTGDDGSDRTAVTAVSVRILDRCTQPSGMPTDRPSDLPSDLPTPSGAPGGRAGGFGTTGEVTAVSGDGFTVAGMGGEDVTVTVTGDTAYTTTAKATASAVAVGVCVTAEGDADDTGAVTASSISVSEPVDGDCTGGFVMGGGPAAAR